MLRLCQGKISPLDGVSLANCPKLLLKLATSCCQHEPWQRPALAHVSSELSGPILSLLDPNVLEARRPAYQLRGWRAAVEAARPEHALAAGMSSTDGTSNTSKCEPASANTNAGESEMNDEAGGKSRLAGTKEPAAARPQRRPQPSKSVLTARPMPAPAVRKQKAATPAPTPEDRTGVALHLFGRHDSNSDGLLDAEELRALAASLGKTVDDDELQEVMVNLGGGHDGVTYDEFLLLWAEGLSFAALRAPEAERAKNVTRREITRLSVADAAAGECEPAQTTSALRASAAEATDTVEPSVLRRMRRQLSALHGFDEGVTRPAKEGPGRLFSRKVSAAVAAAPTGASTASVDAMAPQPLGALEA